MNRLETITGKLMFNQVPCFFALDNGSILKITPESAYDDVFIKAAKTVNGNFDNMDWLFGKTSSYYDIAILPSREQGIFTLHELELTLVVSIFTMYHNSKDTDGKYLDEYKDLKGFTAIDFCGIPVDSCFSPNVALNRKVTLSESIVFLPQDEYCKVFETEISGKKCNLIFTVDIDRKDLAPDDTNLGSLSAILRIEFEERQDLSMIEICWESVCTFLSFCLGQKNITNLRVALSDEKYKLKCFGRCGLIKCQVCHDDVDDVQFRYPTYYRFQIDSLGDKVGRLFSIISNKETRPILGFLRRDNYDNSVDRNKIRDLCTALEVEYEHFKGELKDLNIDELVKVLKQNVKDYKEAHPHAIDEISYNYIHSSLSVISRPARKKFCAVFFKYNDIIDNIQNYQMYICAPINTSKGQTESDIAWIVNVRNGITHSTGITDAIIPNDIFFRLKLAVFCSIFERAGYSKEEIKQIITDYIKGHFPKYLKGHTTYAD